MQTSRAVGMQTFSDALTKLVIAGLITSEEAYVKAVDKEEMMVTMKNAGVSLAFLEEQAAQEEEARRQACAERAEPLRKALETDPNDVGALNDLAWLLATCPDSCAPDPREAIRLAERAEKLTRGDNPSVLDTLAAAYAAAGNTRRAADILRKAIKLATAHDIATDPMTARLKIYEAGKPFREL